MTGLVLCIFSYTDSEICHSFSLFLNDNFFTKKPTNHFSSYLITDKIHWIFFSCARQLKNRSSQLYTEITGSFCISKILQQLQLQTKIHWINIPTISDLYHYDIF